MGRSSLAALLVAGCVALAGAPARAQAPCGADLAGAQRAESSRYVIAYRSDPQKIVVSRHFALEIAVCPKPGAPAPKGLVVDARMPAHGHGMNYRPVVKPAGEGRFRAEGLMFHMPGSWEVAFDVQGAGRNERVTHAVVLR